MESALDVCELEPEHEAAYEDFVRLAPAGLLYHTLRYRTFLRRVVPAAHDRYIVAMDSDGIRAVMPVFVAQGPLGAVVNSLPFFGSHGAVLYRDLPSSGVGEAMVERFREICHEERAITSTIVENLFHGDDALARHYPPDWMDYRTGQFKSLPDSDPLDSEALMATVHSKTRNQIRKGLKSGLVISDDSSTATMDWLQKTHAENLESVGGLVKPRSVFQAIETAFEYGRDYQVFTARTGDGQLVAALLVLYANATVEYFTPAIASEFRAHQPMNAIIHEAMLVAARRGFRVWNWGGTWQSQAGVYHFKSRWGGEERQYRYHIHAYGDVSRLRSLSPGEVQKMYPYFYVIPFSELEPGR